MAPLGGFGGALAGGGAGGAFVGASPALRNREASAYPDTDFVSMALFEEKLGEDRANNDTVVVSSYDPRDAGDTARFKLTVVAGS